MTVIVTTEDLKAVRYCAGGTRRWFIVHGLNWSDFVFNGLDEEAFLATKDALALPLVAAARKRAQESSGG